MPRDDGRERLQNTVELLATSLEPLPKRLELAALTLLPLRAEDFNDPSDGRLLEEIRRDLTAVADPTGEHGHLAMTTLAMSDDAAQDLARKILALHSRIYYAYGIRRES